MRKKIALSLLFVSLTMILIMSLSTFGGFIYLNNLWDNSVAEEVSIILNKELTSENGNIRDLDDLSEQQIKVISMKAIYQFDGQIREIHYYNKSGERTYAFINGDKSKELKFNNLHLLRILNNINHYLKIKRSSYNCKLWNNEQKIIGKVYINAFQVMNGDNIYQYDQMISITILIGLVISIVFSLIAALYISKKISKTSITFATQLIRLSDGERNLEFNFRGTKELQTSAEAAKKLQTQLKLNDDIQQQMIQDIVHDVITPVAAISIQLEAIKEGVLILNEDRINVILKENDTIKDIINELSIYTKLNSKDYFLDQEPFNINDVIQDVCDSFYFKAESKEQVIIYEKPSTSVLLAVNKLGLIRVLNNLLTNALHNAPSKSDIILRLYKQNKIISKEEIVVIEIENTGNIKEKDLPFIFNRLYRGYDSEYKGSGLGLAISKSIVEKNRGRISSKNTQYGTVVFRVEFPKNKSK